MTQEPDAGGSEAWVGLLRSTATRLDADVSGTMIQAAYALWGRGRGRRWDLVRRPERAEWRLHRLLHADRSGEIRFEQLGVRATIDQQGQLVAFQLDNGAEFLAMVDTSAIGLRRGLLHLAQRGLPDVAAAEIPFVPAGGGLLGWLRSLFR